LKLGLIVNPIAGMGGSVGLKGTDGRTIIEQARTLGAVPRAPDRATAALEELVRVLGPVGVEFELLSCASAMGEASALACHLSPTVVYRPASSETTGEDTRRAAREMRTQAVDLLLFAGGDGTARDVHEAVGADVPALGIPAGVKIHSAVFAVDPRAAGALAAGFLRGRRAMREGEVMDVDEAAYRRGQLATRLFGYLRVPNDAQLVQGMKVRSRSDDTAAEELARAVVARMEPQTLYIVGPGTTTRRIMTLLGLESTLLGVDVVLDGQVLALDVAERDLLRLVRKHPRAKIVVTPIGGQGFLFGRGNQQISGRVVRAVGIPNVIVVATSGKLASLGGRPFLVDTDDEELNRTLAGFIAVTTGDRQEAIYAVGQGSANAG
jgi:predicted polyphosphate/ATP-dependent NAD kinase